MKAAVLKVLSEECRSVWQRTQQDDQMAQYFSLSATLPKHFGNWDRPCDQENLIACSRRDVDISLNLCKLEKKRTKYCRL